MLDKLDKEGKARQFLAKTQEFLNMPDGVNSFVLEGPYGDQIIPELSDFVSMFDGFFVMINHPETKQNAMQWHKRVLELTIPPRVLELDIKTNTPAAKTLKQAMSLSGLPYAVLGFGQEVNTQKDIVMLSCVAGMAPATTLKEFQQWSRQRLAAFH